MDKSLKDPLIGVSELDIVISHVFVDKELGSEGFSYVLKSGKDGTIHREALCLSARSSAGSKQSATQFYRLLDQKNYQKSVDQLLCLLHVLDCVVDLVVRSKSASRSKAAWPSCAAVGLQPTLDP